MRREHIPRKPESGRNHRWALMMAPLLLLCFAIAPGVAVAHENSNHGTIKVHDEETANPETRNEPHVDCEDFWIEGFNMAEGSGSLIIFSWPPTGDKAEVMNDTWSAISHDHEKGGFGLLAGPYSLPAGHYRVEVYVDEGHPGNTEHFAKSKLFWVEPCEPEELLCPTGLLVIETGRNGYELKWNPAEDSDGTNIYRAEGDGAFELLATAEAGVKTYTDTTAVPSLDYTYTVTALFGDQESEGCDEAEIAPIPEFPTPIAIGLATLGGTIAYAALVRRKN